MGLLKLKTKLSVEDYLEGEKTSPVRREYFWGEIYPRPDSDVDHNRIAGNLLTALAIHLRNSIYEVFHSQIKVRAAENVIYYPDILVSCEENPENPYFRNRPILIIEVASPSTEKIDRREKLLFYQQMPSVQEYAIVDQHKINIELHRRQPDGRWITYYFDESDTEIEFQSVKLTLPLNEIYRRVRFEKNANTDICE
ncbi:MAG: Uma2 family endonuclease [Pyrinomonadaceae bacterium]